MVNWLGYQEPLDRKSTKGNFVHSTKETKVRTPTTLRRRECTNRRLLCPKTLHRAIKSVTLRKILILIIYNTHRYTHTYTTIYVYELLNPGDIVSAIWAMEFVDERFELREIQKLEGHSDRVWSLAWNPATGVAGVPYVFASCSGDKTVRIWEQSHSTGSWDCKVRFFFLILFFCLVAEKIVWLHLVLGTFLFVIFE